MPCVGIAVDGPYRGPVCRLQPTMMIQLCIKSQDRTPSMPSQGSQGRPGRGLRPCHGQKPKLQGSTQGGVYPMPGDEGGIGDGKEMEG